MENVGKLTMTPEFWKNKKVFITGHTGFKGSWMSLWLQELGAQVKGYSLAPPTSPSLFEKASVADGMESQIADVRDYKSLKKSIFDFSPEIVIHLAAQPLVRLSYKDPIDTYSTNVMGTVNLLQAVREQGSVKAMVNVTSDKCYENKEWPWGYRENEPMGGYDPYSNSKGCAELVTSSFRNSFFNVNDYEKHGCALASARAGNVIGGGDWANDRLIPDILNAIAKGRSVEIRSPHSIRPWQHVLEPLSGYLGLAEKLFLEGPAYAEGWNFGPNDEDAKPVSWIVEQLTKQWGGDASWQLSEGEHPHEVTYLKLDCSKAKQKLRWKPVWRLEDALGRIVAWHKVYLAGESLKAHTVNEINDYMNSMKGSANV